MSEQRKNQQVQLSWGARSFISAPSSAVLGVSIIILSVSMIFFIIASFFIEIDLVVKTRGQTNSLLGIKEAVAQTSGQIESLPHKDGETVKANQVLGRIRIEGAVESDLKKTINLLKDKLAFCVSKECNNESFSVDLPGIFDPQLREPIADVNRKFSQYLYTVSEQKTKSLTELVPLRERLGVVGNKLKYLQSSSMKKYLLMQKETLEEENGRINQQIISLSNQIDERIHQSKADVIHSLRIAIGAFENFILKHQIKSPVDGKITRVSRSQGSFVSQYESIVSITPDASPNIVEAIVETKDVGKIQRGNLAIFSLDAYPPHRYGYFQGKIIGIEHIRGKTDQSDHYIAKVEFGPITPGDRSPSSEVISTLKIVPGMQSHVRIITRRESLSNIIYDKILGIGE